MSYGRVDEFSITGMKVCDCDPKSDICKLGMVRKLSTAEFNRCLVPVSKGISVEEDGDEIFIPLSDVKCCHLGFDGKKSIYSSLIEVTRYGHIYWCCDKCGASYGEKK